MKLAIFLLGFGFLAFSSAVKAKDPPRLPAGLEYSETGRANPALPKGIEKTSPRPRIGDQTENWKPTWGEFESSGFLDARAGIRTQEDQNADQTSLGEGRLQLQFDKPGERTKLRLVTDLLYDPAQDADTRYETDLYKNEGFLDLREASVSIQASDNVDLKAGRQILTWGTGDMIFINDLFPKDWQSFFIGRDIDYLKAPTDAAKFSLFNRFANLDIVYTPRFVPDRYLDGSRISFFSPAINDFIGNDNTLKVDKPDDWFSDDEVALRLYRTLGSYELAAYGYRGYWKRPLGYQPTTNNYTFPSLSVYGISLRAPISQGIGNIEIGYYDSRDDNRGNDPLIRNSELRFLVGYEQEAMRNFNLGLQYYLEHMKDHGSYRDNLPTDAVERDEDRHLLTLRLTYLALNQNLKLSLFTYWSPSDNDGYTRPLAEYKLDDQWMMQTGANWFTGQHKNTFFGQLEDNSNVYLAIRYNFSAN